MIDLEEEFERLMNEVLDKIKASQIDGSYTPWEAEDLTGRVKNLLDHGDTSRFGNRCPEGHGDIEECGWSPSMGYHCS